MGEIFDFANEFYRDKKRSSGESYLEHATNVALIISDMGLDQITIAAAILHDIADTNNLADKKSILETIVKKFDSDIAGIVEKSSELNKIYYSTRIRFQEEKILLKENAENLRKMFFAIAKDLRVILIDLASRIDGLNHIEKLPAKMQKSYATETLEIFVPVANRLGLGEIKRKLEDSAFAYLYPEKFRWLESSTKEKYEQRQQYLKQYLPHIKKILKQESITFSNIDYRAKSYWSTYQKLLTHDMDFEKIYDSFALRIIVDDVADCYKTLGIIHTYFKPISFERIKDYIAKPKINGYQSLHTTVVLEDARIFEIQIRTIQMNEEAEHGVCAHWYYKENKQISKSLETFGIDFYPENIFTFTPKGDVIMLPKGATPIDFAYAIHSDVGNHCESAKIEGKIVPLSEPLKNGDVIEIITNKKKMPSQDWLKFVKTGFAKANVKKILAIPASLFSIPGFIKKKFVEISQTGKKIAVKKEEPKQTRPNQIYLAGQKGMLVNMAKCCNPISGDQVKAYLSRHRAAVLHKISCQNFEKLSKNSPEKVVEASWHQG